MGYEGFNCKYNVSRSEIQRMTSFGGASVLQKLQILNAPEGWSAGNINMTTSHTHLTSNQIYFAFLGGPS
jgi:hypothetical protein